MPTCCLQYIVHLLQIILKFALLSWQVPRSSVGRALYRESGPSQDGDPDTGNLPFSFYIYIYFLIFFNVLFIFPFIPSLQIVWSVFVYSSFPFITLQKVIFHFLASLLFPYTLKLRTCIGTLLSFNINRLRNIVSAVKSF